MITARRALLLFAALACTEALLSSLGRSLLSTGAIGAVSHMLLYSTTCHAETLSNGQDVTSYVKNHIADNDVMVFAKSYCPHCRATRELLKSLHDESDAWSLSIVQLDLFGDEDGPKIQDELQQQTGQRTVPNIFIGGNHVGGNSQLQALHAEGKLDRLLADIVEQQVEQEI